MPTPVNGVLVLIASPGDTAEERATVRDKLADWNATTGIRQGVVVIPWLYERHSIPRVGDRPQALINSQAVDRADAVVAFFDSRLGTPTGTDLSGTVEEIRRASDGGKPVHVYFSSAPIPRDADLTQQQALRDFRSDLQGKALVGEYDTGDDLAAQVVRALEADAEEEAWGERGEPVHPHAAKLEWRHEYETAVKVDSKGKSRTTTTKNRLVVRNAHPNIAAESLTFDLVDAGSGAKDSFRFDAPPGPVTVYGDSELQWTFIPLQAGLNLRIDARWTEGGEERTQIFTVLSR